MTFPAIEASLMAADLACLGNEIRAMTHAGIDAFHWDVMDGHFVPNLTFGCDHIAAARPLTDRFFDVHLLTTDPGRWVDAAAAAGADAVSFHAELPLDKQALIAAIHARGIQAGLALNPETPLDALDAALLQSVDRLIVMTVHPGFGGQAYIDQTAKIRQAAALRAQNPDLAIVVDGGINADTAPRVRAAGATALVSGSYLFKHKNDYAAAIASLRGGNA